MVSLASAIYPGECDSFEFPDEGIVNWTVQDNISSMEGFSFTQNGTNITYCFSGDFAPDSFILTFYTVDGSPEVVIINHYSGGGGSSCIPKKDFDWGCTEWDECISGTQTRTCKEYNNCGNDYGRPNVARNCEVSSLNAKIPEEELQEEITTTNFLTGAVTGVNNFVKSGVSLIFGIIILIAGIFVIIITRKRKSNLYY